MAIRLDADLSKMKYPDYLLQVELLGSPQGALVAQATVSVRMGGFTTVAVDVPANATFDSAFVTLPSDDWHLLSVEIDVPNVRATLDGTNALTLPIAGLVDGLDASVTTARVFFQSTVTGPSPALQTRFDDIRIATGR